MSHADSPLADLIDPGWASALAPVAERIREIGDFLRAERRAGRQFLPAGEKILHAFERPLADVRVLIVGQDPYPTPGHPMGLAFSVQAPVQPLPPSLLNIFQELRSDIDVPAPANGNLQPWADRGVMLLNRVLTVEVGKPGSHAGRGWEAVTECAVKALARRGGPLVAVLWGRQAATVKPWLGNVPFVESPHPSPLSAHRGFFGSKPFSKANERLVEQGAEPIDWRLP